VTEEEENAPITFTTIKMYLPGAKGIVREFLVK
jgi:hypothetical protein